MYGEENRSHFGGGNRGGGFRRSFAPVKVGDELDVKIESVGSQGDGVAKVDGFVLFVPGAKEGETVRVKVTRVLRKVGFAEVVGDTSAESSDENQAEETQEESNEEAEEPLAEETQEEEPLSEEENSEEEEPLAEEESQEEPLPEETEEEEGSEEEKQEE